MKLRNFFIAAVAGLFGLAACEGLEQDLGVAKISIDPLELKFPKEESSQSIKLTATRDWNVNASALPEWIALSATEGKASVNEQIISVTVEKNDGNDREAAIVITAGMVRATLTVKQAGAKGEIQKGSGTLEDPYSVAGVIEYTQSLGADVQSTDKVYFKGIVSDVATTFEGSGNYGNASFYIVDSEGSTDKFYVFQTYYLGNRQWKSGDTEIKAGDEVIVYGPVVNYKGNTPETVGKGSSFIYSLNGQTEGGVVDEGEAKGDGTLDNPFNPAGAAAYAQSLGADVQSDKSVYIKGKISKVSTTFEASGNYGNANFYIVDATDGKGEFYIFQTYYLGNRKWAAGDTDVKEGDEVIVYGPVVNFRGNTPETVGKGASYIYSLNGQTEGSNEPQPPVDYNNAEAKTVADFIAAADKNTYYKLTGEVGGSINTQYGNFDLTDETGTIYVYGTDNISEYASKLKAGAKVTLAAKYDYYEKNQKHEAVHAYILSIEEGETPDYNNAPAKTVADFIAAADKNTYYKLTGEVGGSINTQYGNFDLTDETGTIYVYGTDNISEYASKLKAGAKVTLAAKYDYYEKNQKHEAVHAYILSIEGGSDQPGQTEDYSNAPAKTVAEFIAAADKANYYKLTGEVGGSINTQYGNFDLTDETGTIYVYGTDNISEYASKLKAGAKVTLAAKYDYYEKNQKHEAVHAYILSIEGGSDQPGQTEDYSNAPAKTVAEFIAAADKANYYKLTGEVGGSINTQYGNFDLTDETGTIYVYGTDNISEYASKLKAGARVMLAAKYDYYEKNQKHEAVHAYILSIEGGSDQQPDPTTGDDSAYASNVTWTLGSNAYDNVSSTVNGVTGVKTLKLGTSSKFGDATLKIPAGATKLTFYAISWNNAAVATLVFSVDGAEIGKVNPVANSGLKGTSTYELTVTDSDKFEIAVTGGTDVKVETTGGYRAALFAVHAE